MRCLTRRNGPLIWSANADRSFMRVKELLSSSTILKMFDPPLTVTVSTDASNCGLGAVLQQQDGHQFASRTLSPVQRKYSVGECEALACIWACERWHTYLWGRRFTLQTDHQALVSLLASRGSGRRPLRIARWNARLLRHNLEVVHKKALMKRTLFLVFLFLSQKLNLPQKKSSHLSGLPGSLKTNSSKQSYLTPGCSR